MTGLRLVAAVWFAVVGAALGSFLTVVVTRLPEGRSVVHPPSHCPRCGTRLRAAELVPVLSYLLQRGRCRHCGEGIPPRYLLIELTAALGSGALAFLLLPSSRLFPALLLLLLGIAASAIDVAHGIIPDRLLLIGALLAFGWRLFGGTLLPGVLGAALLTAIALVIALVGRGMFGLGDLKYLAVVGLALGPAEGGLAFFLAVMTGGIYAVALLVLRRATRRDAIAFGPFIALGSVAAAAVGPALLTAYTRFL